MLKSLENAVAILGLALLCACALPREKPPAEVTGATAAPRSAVSDEPVEGHIPDGINPLTKEQEDAVIGTN